MLALRRVFDQGRRPVRQARDAQRSAANRPCGSVAVNRHGGRVGKGGGYSDLEFALLAESKKIRNSMTETLKLIQFRAAYNLPVHAGIENENFARHDVEKDDRSELFLFMGLHSGLL